MLIIAQKLILIFVLILILILILLLLQKQRHFGASGRPLGSQNGTPKWFQSVQNELQNGVCKIRLDFDEKMPPQGGSGDPQGTLMGAQLAPRRASWASRNRPNELSRGSECTQNNISKIDVNFEDPKSLKDVQDVHFGVLQASMFIKKRWKSVCFLDFEVFRG